MMDMTNHKATLLGQAEAVRRLQSRSPRVFHLTAGQRRTILAHATAAAAQTGGPVAGRQPATRAGRRAS